MDKCKAIYFSAWEDDYSGDPLVAIIGQLWDALKESDWKEIGKSVAESAKPLFVDVALGLVGLTEENLKSTAERAVDEYFDVRAKRDDLKTRLKELAAAVAKDTGSPLIFIIDELDRCRPTFAIEVLERIKHLFNIPHLVFVLGIDRDQLGSSVQAVYGNIDVDGYLRRFFDMEFSLPEADPTLFSEHLLTRYEIASHFQVRSKNSEAPIHVQDFREFRDVFPRLCYRFELSLRDMEHVIRLFIFVTRNLQDRYMLFPLLLTTLLMLRSKNNDLYLRYVQGKCLSADVLNYIERFFIEDNLTSGDKRIFEQIEMKLYSAAYIEYANENPVRQQLVLLTEDKELSPPYHVSERTRGKSAEAATQMLKWYDHIRHSSDTESRETLAYLSVLTELAGMMKKD